MHFLFYLAAISVLSLKLEMFKCFKHVAVIKQHSKLHGADVNETEKETAKIHDEVSKVEEDKDKVKSNVIEKVISVKSKFPLPITPGEKTALKKEILEEEKNLLENAENEANNASEMLIPLEASIKNNQITDKEATLKLGEAEAALQEARVIASAGVSMDKKLTTDENKME
ncbi:uncharacterized protein LOC128884006 [Hylaeus volcanicus]|uniref:uncharacterized protein LOC128884006 n=1 Tax=Hylaeus volcanicus TaxID=313075 RepID=UPI0023B80A20|nr:uncharacterized protein LOC128884006 [Hylaeus volcanicus]